MGLCLIMLIFCVIGMRTCLFSFTCRVTEFGLCLIIYVCYVFVFYICKESRQRRANTTKKGQVFMKKNLKSDGYYVETGTSIKSPM